MSLLNNISVDLGASTASIVSTISSTTIESITYTNSTQTITHNIIPGYTLTKNDFITLVNQIVAFQSAVTLNFQPSALILPFNSWIANEHYITFINSWSLTCSEVSGPTVVQFLATPGTGIVLSARAAAITIPYSEWLLLIANKIHYLNSVNSFM